MAITTTYNGIEYRSRLEARWAAFMQNIGWDIIYEPFDGDGYIPDFLVQGERPFLVEVKPAVSLDEYQAPVDKAERGLAEHWRHDIVVVGASHTRATAGQALPRAGWIGEYQPDEKTWWWGDANWMLCMACQQICLRSEDYNWDMRPCGHDHKQSLYARADMLSKAWADACNDVKWRGTAA